MTLCGSNSSAGARNQSLIPADGDLCSSAFVIVPCHAGKFGVSRTGTHDSRSIGSYIARATSSLDLVAVKELNSSYHIGETLSFSSSTHN